MTTTPEAEEATAMTTPTPFPHLIAAQLRHAWSVLTGEAFGVPAESLTFGGSTLADGTPVETIVRLRDLYFIHELDASRFGTDPNQCPICVAEGEPDESDYLSC